MPPAASADSSRAPPWRCGVARRWPSSGRSRRSSSSRVALDELHLRLVDDLLEDRIATGDRA